MHESRSTISKEAGASLVEYALLVSLIGMLGITAMNILGASLNTRFSTAANSVGGSCQPPHLMFCLIDPPHTCFCQ